MGGALVEAYDSLREKPLTNILQHLSPNPSACMTPCHTKP